MRARTHSRVALRAPFRAKTDPSTGDAFALGLYPARVAVITVNGKEHELTELSSLADLIKSLALEAGQITVERNKEIVARANYAHTQLEAGDHLEIVTFVGGG